MRPATFGKSPSGLATQRSKVQRSTSEPILRKSWKPWRLWFRPRYGVVASDRRISYSPCFDPNSSAHYAPSEPSQQPASRDFGIQLRISMGGAYLRFCGAPQNRKGIDGLAELCRERLSADPFSGCLFIFRSRRATAIKLLQYDGQGFVLAQKRLSKGRFIWWPKGNGAARTLEAYQAQLLVAAGNPDTHAAPMWRSVS